MPSRKRSAPDESSSDEEINIDKMVETKNKLNKIRKDREKKRSQLQKDLDKKLDGLRARMQQVADAHTQQLTAINQQQVERLKAAIKRRDGIDQLIRKKLAGMQRDALDLVALLDSGWQHRQDKAQSLHAPSSQEQKPTHGHPPARPAKRAKTETTSC